LKVTARPIGSEDIEPSEEERRQLSEGEEDLTNVDAEPSELMGSWEKPHATLIFGQSWATRELVESYVQKGYFGPGVYRALVMRLHRTLAMESVLCSGTSFLPVCVFRWTPFFRGFWPGLVFGCTILPPTPSCSYRSSSGRSKPLMGRLAWMLSVDSMRCIHRRGMFLLAKIHKYILLRVGVVRSIQGGPTRPKGST